MILDVATLLSLAGACAPTVAPETLISIVHTESRFNSLAIGVNSPGVRAPKPATKAQASCGTMPTPSGCCGSGP